MTTFLVVYIICAFFNLAVVRLMVHRKEFTPSGANAAIVFIPIINVIVAFGFAVMGITMLMYWIANGTLD